ncbi:MAG: hypothetical protein KIT83_19975 [Bryobacterales bacterium]|nr:hypothetical protein [Bryobacterales bacterium]
MMRKLSFSLSANTFACAVVMMLALLAASCTKTEAPVAEGQSAEAPADTPEAAAAQPGAGNAAPNAMAPSGTRPSSSTPSQTASRPAGQAASSSNTSGWGDQPTQPMQAQSAAPAAPVAKTYTLPAGSTLRVRTTSTMSTKNLETGAAFAGSLAEPLEVDGKVIAQRGANVAGRIVNSDPGGRVKGRAMLQVAVTQVQLVNGEMADVSTNAFEQIADASTGKDAAKVAIGSGVGAAIGAIAGGGKGAAIGAGVGAGAGTGAVLATRGSDAVIPAESTLSFSTQGPISVQLP